MRKIVLLFTIITCIISGCANKNVSYSIPDNPPANVDESFYKESVKVFDLINEHFIDKSNIPDDEYKIITEYRKNHVPKTKEELDIAHNLELLEASQGYYIKGIRNKEDVSGVAKTYSEDYMNSIRVLNITEKTK